MELLIILTLNISLKSSVYDPGHDRRSENTKITITLSNGLSTLEIVT